MIRINEISKAKLMVVFLVSVTLLTWIFIMTMLKQQRAIDYSYLWFALPRIAIIGLLSSVLSVTINKRHLVVNIIFAILVSYSLSALYVFSATKIF